MKDDCLSGARYEAHLPPKTCYVVPLYLKFAISGIQASTPICIEMYDTWDCRGTSRRLIPEYPFHDNLSLWGFGDTAKSFSFCGVRCGDSEPKIQFAKTDNPHLPDKPYITLFTHKELVGELNS